MQHYHNTKEMKFKIYHFLQNKIITLLEYISPNEQRGVWPNRREVSTRHSLHHSSSIPVGKKKSIYNY